MDAVGSEKSSRYLRQIDRRSILARIERGEKQSALAKEFHVTRAAICNFNKHRELIMTRACDDPMAKHPKWAKPSAHEDDEKDLGRDENHYSSTDNRASPSDAVERKAPTSQLDDQVCVVDSRAVAMLRVLVHDRNTSELAFQHHCARLMVCLVEEAVAWMYTQHPQQLLRLGSHEDNRDPPHSFMLDEYYIHRPPCGITVDELGSLFLDKFRSMDPTWRCGAIEFPDPSVGAPSGLPIRMDLPRAMPACNVFLLLSFARDGGCSRLHQSVRILIDHGVVEELLCLVALGISSRAVSLLHAEFPRLRVATAALEREADDSQDGGRVRHRRDALGSVGTHERSQEGRTPTERLAKLAVSSG